MAPAQKPLLKLEEKDAVLIKPSKSTPSSVLPLSTLDNRPDVNFLCQTVHVYRPTVHDSDSIDPAQVVKEALSKALIYYYPLAGRLVRHADGKLRVHCNEEEYGVPFIEAVASCNLSSVDYLDGADTEFARHLVFDLPTEDEQGYQYPLVIKLTKFLCGGFTIGLGMSHSVVDGIGGSQFFRAVVELASGRSEPSVKPVWERHRLVGLKSITDEETLTRQPMDNASSAVSPFLPKDELIQVCFKVSGETLKRLKWSLEKESNDGSIATSFESLGAYVWRSRTRALEQNNDGKTQFSFLVGARKHLLHESPLLEGYYGNAIVDAYVVLTVKELNKMPLSDIVKRIREAKNAAFSADYVKNFMNTKESNPVVDFTLYGNGAIIFLTEWKHVGFSQDVDFGGNEAVNMVPAPSGLFGGPPSCIFAPPNKLDDPSMKGGVRIFTTLPVDAVAKFRKEMEAMNAI